MTIWGTGFKGVSDVFEAGCAKSLRSSFPAWALRIFATISGLVFEGGGAGSGGTAATVCLATTATGALPVLDNVLSAGVFAEDFEGFLVSTDAWIALGDLVLAVDEGNDDFAATGLVAVGLAIGFTTDLAATGLDTADAAFLAAIKLPFTAVVCEVFSDGVFGFGFFELSIGILGADFLVEAEFVVAILATLLGFTDLAAATPFFPLVATTFLAVVVFEVIPMADLEPLAAFSNFLAGLASTARAVGFLTIAKGFLGAGLVFFDAFKVRNS